MKLEKPTSKDEHLKLVLPFRIKLVNKNGQNLFLT